jgi:hypothetical protein
MNDMSWFRQKRVDGGIRTGIDVNDTYVFHRFENESDEPDPVLLWYVDVRCKGARLPKEPEEVRQWFLDHSEIIRNALSALAQELRAGMDVDIWPVQRKIPGTPRGVKMCIVCSTSLRIEALDIARVLTDIAKHWEDRIRNLPVVVAERTW